MGVGVGIALLVLDKVCTSGDNETLAVNKPDVLRRAKRGAFLLNQDQNELSESTELSGII